MKLLARSGGKSKEIQEEMGAAVKNYRLVGGGCADDGPLLQGGGPSRHCLLIVDVYGNPSHQQNDGGFLQQYFPPTEG